MSSKFAYERGDGPLESVLEDILAACGRLRLGTDGRRVVHHRAVRYHVAVFEVQHGRRGGHGHLGTRGQATGGQIIRDREADLLGPNHGMVRHVSTSPAYELPNSGSGLPQFVLGETLIWSDDEKEATKDQTFFTHVHLHVKNDGKTPLHLYRLTLVEKGQGRTVQDKTVGFVLPLVAPAVVPPGMSEVVSFKAITGTAVDSTKSYLLYISHSGFRSHVFEGILDGKTFLSREEAVQPQGEDGLFDRFSLDSVSGQSLFPSFPYATWQGTVSRYVQRNDFWIYGYCCGGGTCGDAVYSTQETSARLMGHAVKRCLRSPSKKGEPGGRTSAKPVSNRVASSRAAISKRGEDHIEMERYIRTDTVLESLSRMITWH
ncbi:hypothetical protein GQ600_4734 [Phytophthora cactorum]|nr:hypothetical protein GQ600_4734 [Phytophthora cactorum]